MIVAPNMQSKQPNFPKNDNLSFKKNEDKIAQMTTDRAPIGVTNFESPPKKKHSKIQYSFF